MPVPQALAWAVCREDEGRESQKRSVQASVKIGIVASCLAFILTNVRFFLSLSFILAGDGD